MKRIKEQLLPFERLTREDGHYFFGYYDIEPWSADGRFHLAHRVPFMDRMPSPADRADIGMIRMRDNRFIPLAETYAWNFQQGAMLQWHPLQPASIIYNALRNGAYRGVILDTVTGVERTLSRPVANVDPAGRYALSINFSRMFDFRPGYGYAGIPDRFAADDFPKDDGIFLIDLSSGESRLIIPLAALREVFHDVDLAGMKLLVNHITFNTDGSRFVFLLRTMASANSSGGVFWKTATLTANTDGSDVFVLGDFGMASHYIWRTKNELLIYADAGEGAGLNLLNDRTRDHALIDKGFFTYDGHCSYSLDKNFILYDSYPDADGYRKLVMYDIKRKRGMNLAVLHHGRMDALPCTDIRCDLHPRFSRDGNTISFDSIHEGHRHIYTMDVGSIIQ
ncbi:MAG: hypothetical protein HZC28_00290 [Spirochaetes bacterium]|nr:hypothetical protein [Spirochaetota bacterium]